MRCFGQDAGRRQLLGMPGARKRLGVVIGPINTQTHHGPAGGRLDPARTLGIGGEPTGKTRRRQPVRHSGQSGRAWAAQA